MNDLYVFTRCCLCHERQATAKVDGYDGGLCVNCVAGEVWRLYGDKSFAAVSDFLHNVKRQPIGGRS